MKEQVLLMYSGGLYSILSMAKLMHVGYKVLLVHFDNGCSILIGNEVLRTKQLQEAFGIDNVEYIVKISTMPVFRYNELQIANMTFSQIKENKELKGKSLIPQLVNKCNRNIEYF